MVASSRPAPLEVFLNSIGSGAVRSTESKAADLRSKAESCRTVILTVLGQATTPMPRDVLARSTELASDWFEIMVKQLEFEGLIEQSGAAYVLTGRGREAAERERARLLSF